MPAKLSLVVHSGAFDRVHYALVMAAAALATNVPVTLFFTMGAARALAKPGADGRPGWSDLPAEGNLSGADLDRRFAEAGVGTFEELLGACVTLGATVMVCEMGLKAMGLTQADLRADVPIAPGGMVTFLADAGATAQIVFV